jgi:transglutaminase-like putative cysteine protease
MDRRTFVKAGLIASAGVAAGGIARRRARAATPAAAPGWRTFEVTTKVELLEPAGASRAWLPVPLFAETDYFKRATDDKWTGNATTMKIAHDPKYGAGIFCAEWPATEKAPVVELTSRFSTRDRRLDFANKDRGKGKDDPAELKKYLQPSKLVVTDGIVAATAAEITKGKTSDIDKARAIYEWIVDNTFRDPKVRGCGVGDIRPMLETKYLGGKCADLNALYVGLARASGLPARDVYGVRVAASAEFKSLGKADDITKAQHCRAEVFLRDYGWVAVDPADVRKVVLEERPEGLKLDDPLVQKARAKLFGGWEMNWVPWNRAHDVELPGASGPPVAFFMYPQAETGRARKDCLDPPKFKYTIASREIQG